MSIRTIDCLVQSQSRVTFIASTISILRERQEPPKKCPSLCSHLPLPSHKSQSGHLTAGFGGAPSAGESVSASSVAMKVTCPGRLETGTNADDSETPASARRRMADAVDFIVALACEEEGGKERFLSHTSTMIQCPNAIATARRHARNLTYVSYDTYRLYVVHGQVAASMPSSSVPYHRLSYPPVYNWLTWRCPCRIHSRHDAADTPHYHPAGVSSCCSR